MPMTKKLILTMAMVLLSVSTSAWAGGPGEVRYIIVASLPVETKGLSAMAPVVHTGAGKVKAAIGTYDAILQYQPELVINYGTAGSVSGVSGLHRVDVIIQRDMDARGFGIPRGVTPMSNEPLPEARGIVLGTGDSFVVDAEQALEGLEIRVDMVDMEAFAIEEVAEHLGVKFVSYKYVSDSADDGAATDWEANAAKGASLFAELLEKEYGKSSLL